MNNIHLQPSVSTGISEIVGQILSAALLVLSGALSLVTLATI